MSTRRPRKPSPNAAAGAPAKPPNRAAVKTPARPSPASGALKPTPARNPAAKPAAPKHPAASHAQPKSGNWINRTVQNSVAGVGNYAAGLVHSIGDSVNRVGQGVGNQISNTTRYWGQGVAGYGNNIKDSVGVGGPRVVTAGNPLGLAGQGSAQGSAGKKIEGAARRSGGGSASNPLGLS